MLRALVRNSGLDRHLDAVISVDAKRAYKPDPRAYEPVQEQLGVPPDEVLFISSNGFDVAGAKSFGFKVARIERVTPAALQREQMCIRDRPWRMRATGSAFRCGRVSR